MTNARLVTRLLIAFMKYSMSTNLTTIRKVIVDVVSSHKHDLVHKRPFQELIRSLGDFVVDLTPKISDSRN